MKKYTAFLVGALLLLPMFAGAASIETKQELYRLGADESIKENAYLLAETVRLDGNSIKDIYAGAGRIEISGPVGEDATLFGGQIMVDGAINQDLRIAGGEVQIENAVGGDLIILGGQIDVRKNTTVGGDLIIVGGEVRSNARVNGRVHITGGSVTLGGNIEGGVTIYGGEINIESGTVIGGDLVYYSSEEAWIDEGVTILGETVYHENQVRAGGWKDKNFKRDFDGGRLISTLFVALIAFWFFRKKINILASEATQRSGKDFLRGLLVFAATPILVLGLMITIIGIPIAFIVMAGSLALYLTAIVLAGAVFGAVCQKHLFKKSTEVDVWVLVLGTLALHIISLIPVIGCIVYLIFAMIAFGSIMGFFYRKVWLD